MHFISSYKTHNNYTFENQIINYSCGPISIINALRYENQYIGGVQRREIFRCCGIKLNEPNYEGSDIRQMNRTICLFWPKAFMVHGIKKCNAVIQNAAYSKYIMLYVMERKGRMYWHYIFMYKDGGKMHQQNKYNLPFETISTLRNCIKFRHCPYIWVLQ